MGVIDLNIFVQDPTSTLNSFDVIRVERSTTLVSGPFSEVTGPPPAAAATLLSSIPGPYVVGGLTLQLLVDSAVVVPILFSGSGSRTVAQVVADINAAISPHVASDDATHLRLRSTLLGTISRLEIVGGTAVIPLGFTVGQRDIGEEPYIPLASGVSDYTFSDRDGEAGYYYRVRFFNTSTGLLSSYSAPFLGAPGTLVSGSSLSIGSIDMVDATGTALAEQHISFVSVHQPLQVEGFQVALDRKLVTVETDNAGHAEVTLVRGLRVKVVFEEIGLIREIIVPNAPTFDIMALVSAAPDPFSVAIPNLPAALRRTI
jgi:hypothetical protein